MPLPWKGCGFSFLSSGKSCRLRRTPPRHLNVDVIQKPETGWRNQAGRDSGRTGRRTFVRPVCKYKCDGTTRVKCLNVAFTTGWNHAVGRQTTASAQRFHGVMVSTLDSESSDPSSNLGGTCLFGSRPLRRLTLPCRCNSAPFPQHLEITC